MGDVYSVNERAEKLLGRRPEGVPIDLPLELGYECPIHQDHSEDLMWSEYNGFLWCERCNRDYPSALCVPMESHATDEWKSMAWFRFGPEAAVEIFLDTVQEAARRTRAFTKEDTKVLTDRKWTVNQLVAHNLRRARQLRGWTQDEAAEQLEPHIGSRWSKATFSAAERSVDGNRIRQFTADNLVAFSKTFELSVTWFLQPPLTKENTDEC